MSTPPKPTRTTVPSFRARKRRLGADPLVVLTAYDAATTAVAEAGGVDALLVGDSLGMVVLGYETTLPVTLDEVLHHARAVGPRLPSWKRGDTGRWSGAGYWEGRGDALIAMDEQFV